MPMNMGVWSATAAGTNAATSATHTAVTGQTFVVTNISGHADTDAVITIEAPAGTIFYQTGIDVSLEGIGFNSGPLTIPLPRSTNAVGKISASTTDCQVNICGYIV